LRPGFSGDRTGNLMYGCQLEQPDFRQDLQCSGSADHANRVEVRLLEEHLWTCARKITGTWNITKISRSKVWIPRSKVEGRAARRRGTRGTGGLTPPPRPPSSPLVGINRERVCKRNSRFGASIPRPHRVPERIH